jgi:hypothetical protein
MSKAISLIGINPVYRKSAACRGENRSVAVKSWRPNWAIAERSFHELAC